MEKECQSEKIPPIYIVSGGGELAVGTATHVFGRGSLLHIPAGVPHSLTLVDANPSVALHIFSPSGPETGVCDAGNMKE